jgi:signal transduction histidine kinase
MNKNTIIRFLLILFALVLISGAVFYIVSVPRHATIERAAGGVLDLRNGDFSRDFFALDGEWEFYFGELVAPQDFAALDGLANAYISLPGGWKAQGYPVEGFATYRLRVLANESALMLFVPEIMSAGVLFINDARVFEAGLVARSPEEAAMGLRNAFVPFNTEGGAAEIVMWVSNYHGRQGGLASPLVIGRADMVLRDVLMRRALVGVFIGFALMAGIYHFILFLHRRNDMVYLLFTMLCLILAARFFLEINGPGMLFLPGGLGIRLYRAYFALVVLSVAALIFFTHSILRMSYGDGARHVIYKLPFIAALAVTALAVFIMVRAEGQRIGAVVLLAAAAVILFGVAYGGRARRFHYGAPLIVTLALALFAPFTIVEAQWMGLAVLPLAMTVVFVFKEKTLKKSPYNALYIISLSVFVIWGPLTRIILNDYYFASGVTSNLFMIIIQCIMLSINYADAKHTEDALTERNKFLNRLNRTKIEFLQNMSHEMKTPLTVIATGIDFADREIIKEIGLNAESRLTEASDALETIREETQRLGRMVGGMVNLAAMNEAGETRKRTDFAALIKNSAEAFRLAIEQKGISLRTVIAPGMPDVYVEADTFTQVMANLFSNAVDHTENGYITLAADFDSSTITVRVTDTGKGIPPELLPRVFRRGESGRGGTGFGLYICKTAVEAHGGMIKIESEPGKGTIAIFTVPVYAGQEAGHTL